MKQSIFVFAILLLAGLFLAACQGNGERNNVLPELQLQPYKEEAKASLTAYIDALDPGDYSDENWAAIEEIANTGKENIDMAPDKQGVDSALATALDEIGMIDKEPNEADVLAKYKEGAKASLMAYVEALEPGDYSEENWAAIEEIANTGKENIDMAADKQGVDTALAAAKDEIGLINIKQKEEDELAKYKEDAKANLAAYVETLEPEGYSEENWALVQAAFLTGNQAIDAAANATGVDAALNAAFKEIHLVDYEGRDFVLSISVEETTIQQGEDFKVNVALKNNSGEDHEIFFKFLFYPQIPRWDPLLEFGIHDIWEDSKSMFEAGSILQPPGTAFQNNDWEFGYTLKPGKHELKFSAWFCLNLGQEDQQTINVWSNVVIITVQ